MSGRLEELLADEFGHWLHRMHGVTSSCDHLVEAGGLSAVVLDLLDSPEAREVVAGAIHEYETAVGSLEETSLDSYTEVALAALREWLEAES